MQKRLVLTILSALSVASAAVPKANIFHIEVAPQQQQLALSLEVDLGFPLGKRTASVRLDCTKGKPPVIRALQETVQGYGDDPEGTKGVLAAKVVQSSGQAVTVNGWYQPIRFYCKDKILYMDYSKILKDHKAQFASRGSSPLNIEWLAETMIKFDLPIRSRINDEEGLYSSGISLHVLPKSGIINDMTIGAVTQSKQEALFFLDKKSNILLPLQYGGSDADTSKIVGRPVGRLIELYYAPDFSKPTGWSKTTVDLDKGLIWWSPASKPAGAKFAN